MSRFEKNYGKWDIIDSTYQWDIKLQNKFSPLRGYSKGLNLPEMQDKNALLIAKINKIWIQCRYCDKSEFMEIKRRDTFGTNHQVVVTLFPNRYELDATMLGNSSVEAFLEKAYHYLRTGEQPDLMIKVPKSTKLPEMDKSKHFSDKKALWNYCNERIKDGSYAKGQVEHYYREMCEKLDFDGRFKRDNQEPPKIQYQSQRNQAPTQQQQQNHSNTETQTEFRRTPKITTNSQGQIQMPEVEKEKTFIENYREQKFKQLYTLYFKMNYINMDSRVKQTINQSFDNAQNKSELDDYFENFSKLIINKQLR